MIGTSCPQWFLICQEFALSLGDWGRVEDPYVEVHADLCRSNGSWPPERGISFWKERQRWCPGGWVSPWVSAISSSEGNKEGTAVTRGIFACLQADKDRRDLNMDSEEIDADKMSRFIRINELRLVTEYNPTVISSSSLPSPQHPASSIRASSGSSVYAWGCVQGLPQWCRWVGGSHAYLCCCRMVWEQTLHWSRHVGWRDDRRQFFWSPSRFEALMGKELHFLPLLLLLPLGICHVVPCLQILLSQDPLSVAEKPQETWKPKRPAPRSRLFFTQKRELSICLALSKHIQKLVGNFSNKNFPTPPSFTPLFVSSTKKIRHRIMESWNQSHRISWSGRDL